MSLTSIPGQSPSSTALGLFPEMLPDSDRFDSLCRENLRCHRPRCHNLLIFPLVLPNLGLAALSVSFFPLSLVRTPLSPFPANLPSGSPVSVPISMLSGSPFPDMSLHSFTRWFPFWFPTPSRSLLQVSFFPSYTTFPSLSAPSIQIPQKLQSHRFRFPLAFFPPLLSRSLLGPPFRFSATCTIAFPHSLPCSGCLPARFALSLLLV